MKTLVLGLGNLLLGDEGLGVHAAQALMFETVQGVVVRDVGTAVLEVLSDLSSATRIIVLDALKANGPPGTIYRITLHQCRPSSIIGSMHGFDLQRVFALAEGDVPPEVTVLGMVPSVINWTLELSPQVAEAFPKYLETVRHELNQTARK